MLPEENSQNSALTGEPNVEDRELIEGSAQFLAEDKRRKISAIQRQIAWRRT
ncbi:MAG: hypothetical protein WCF23_03110 [Candidatus Nitrosopolaris sp.]